MSILSTNEPAVKGLSKHYEFECWRCKLMRDSKLEVRCDWCGQELCARCAVFNLLYGLTACSRRCMKDLREERKDPYRGGAV